MGSVYKGEETLNDPKCGIHAHYCVRIGAWNRSPWPHAGYRLRRLLL